MEHRCKSQQQQIFELKQELTNNVAELKLRLAQSEGNTHTQTTQMRKCPFCYFYAKLFFYGISRSDRPSGNREAKVQTSSGGHGQSTPEGGTCFKILVEIRGKYIEQTTVAYLGCSLYVA